MFGRSIVTNVLDNLFQWAAEQPAENITSCRLAMATNELTRNNLVSYAEGTLFYSPGRHVGLFFVPARFSSEPNGITQYFSDRRFAPNGGFETAPFDPNNTDPLDITISPPFLLTHQYGITVHSSKWDFQFTVNPSFDAATGSFMRRPDPPFSL